MHVHIRAANGDAKFWLEPRIELAENNGLRSSEITIVRRLIEEHQDEIEGKWKPTLDAEVSQMDQKGIWLLIGEKEFFLPYEKFPWFRNVTVAEIHDLQLLSDRHLYWPQLDVDLAIESIEHPERFPLISK